MEKPTKAFFDAQYTQLKLLQHGSSGDLAIGREIDETKLWYEVIQSSNPRWVCGVRVERDRLIEIVECGEQDLDLEIILAPSDLD